MRELFVCRMYSDHLPIDRSDYRNTESYIYMHYNNLFINN